MPSKLLVGTAVTTSLSRFLRARTETQPSVKALMLHRDYAMNGALADLKAFAADIVPKIEMHIHMANDLENRMRIRPSKR